MPLNVIFGALLIAALGLLPVAGGWLHVGGYALVALVALFELTFAIAARRSQPSLPGDDWLGGAGVREPRSPRPSPGSDAAPLESD